MSAWAATHCITFKYIYCIFHWAITPIPMMADFPSARVRPSRLFTYVAVEYAAPFLIKDKRHKEACSVKEYLTYCCAHRGRFWLYHRCFHYIVTSLCVSLRTPVIHIFELRYELYGTNRHLQQLFSKPAARELYSGTIACHWHFNPIASPHFGGLWEAMVKSCKYHLKSVIET